MPERIAAIILIGTHLGRNTGVRKTPALGSIWNDLQMSSETVEVAVAVRHKTRSTSCSSAKRAIFRYSGRKLAPHYAEMGCVSKLLRKMILLTHLRYTVRLVNSEQRNFYPIHHGDESFIIESVNIDDLSSWVSHFPCWAPNLSGATYRIFSPPESTSFFTQLAFSVVKVLSKLAAFTPRLHNASTWSFMRAIKGDMTSVNPW